MRPVGKARLLFWLILALFILVGFGDMEHRFLYFPENRLIADPADFGLDYEDVWLTCEDNVQLHGWFIPGKPQGPAVLFFHGNAGNISHRIENLRLFHERLGTPVLIIDYRGYGRSEGHADEQGLYRDAQSAADWLLEKGFTADRQIYFGRSLGAAVALELALQRPPAGLVMESPFTSIAAMARHHYPLLNLAFGWLVTDRYDNRAKIDSLQVPLLVIHGRKDRIVPQSMVEALLSRTPETKSILWLDKAGHNDTLSADPDRYWQAWRNFIDMVEKSSAEPTPHSADPHQN